MLEEYGHSARAPYHVSLIMRSSYFAGPVLARVLTERGSRLVLHAPSKSLVDGLEARGARVAVITEEEVPVHGPGSSDTADGCKLLVERGLDAFGRLDSISMMPTSMSQLGFVRGPLLEAAVSDVHAMIGYFESTFHALRAAIPVLRSSGGGQILVFTSGQGLRPVRDWALYGGVRAGQHFMLQAVALEHAADNIQVNALASKNAFFDQFPAGVHDDHAGSQLQAIEAEVPLGRPGTMEELGWFAASLLDGRNRFQTGQCFGFTGGWEIG